MKRFTTGFTSVTKTVCYRICFVSMALIMVMMLLMFVDAMLGLIFNNRITGSYELVQCMLCVIVFLSWSYTQTEHGHINVVMFVRLMPQKLRFICYGLTSLLSCVTMGFASYGVFLAVLDKFKNSECTGTLLIPFWPFYVLEFIAFVMFGIVLLCDTIKVLVAIFDTDMAEEVMENWT